MFCLKCGREISEGQVFCQDCCLDMARHPVKPGTPVQLPKHRENSAIRRNAIRRRSLSPEEQIRKLRKSLRTLVVLWVVTFLLLCAALYPAALYIFEEEHFLPGQNYSLIESLMPTEE